MKEINQKKALGVSLKVFAMLIIVVCLAYHAVTPSVRFANMWFSYVIGIVLYAIGFFMAL